MKKLSAGWLALIVVFFATIIMVVFGLPRMNRDGETVSIADVAADALKASKDLVMGNDEAKTAETEAEKPADTAASGSEPAKPAAETAEAKPEATEPAKEEASAGDKTPSFDVLRVEPDGSTVIAGNGEPGAKLEIMDGDKVLTTSKIESSGDFAAVLDNPLPPGDHQLTLKTTAEDGKTASSEEVATISVPSDDKGQLLAMVTKPGEASRIITAPTEEPKAAEAPAPAPAQATAEPKAPATETASAEPAAAKPEAPATATETAAKPETPASAATEKPTNETAAAAAEPDVRISAVELEGDKVFVAGSAAPGARVRAYADGHLIGEYPADDKGRFVIDGAMKLSVGDHEIRTDVVDADGKVLVRATVPFNRPEGEAVAAVAGQAPATPAPAPTEVAQAAKTDAAGTEVTSMANFDKMQFEKLSTEAMKALNLLKGLYADGKTPSAEELAAARSALEIALKSVAEYKFADETDAETKASLQKVAAHAAKALAALKALPADAKALGPKLAAIEGTLTGTIEMASESSAQTPALPAASTELATKAPDIAVPDAKPDASATPAETKPAPAPASAETQVPPPPAGSTDLATKAPDIGGTPAPAATDSAQPAAPAEQKAIETPPLPAGSADLAGKAPETMTNTDTAAKSDTSATDTAEPKTIVQAPLENSDTSVIIRRGDTLWQIARRVYGKGVRYTTIYLANEDKIRDPDMIEPGQVFGLPDKAAPNAEEMHKRHLKGLPIDPASK
jgi:nucleoid-associated protein YgaU